MTENMMDQMFGKFFGSKVRDAVITSVESILLDRSNREMTRVVRLVLGKFGEIPREYLEQVIPFIVDEAISITLDLIHTSEEFDITFSDGNVILSLNESDGPGAEYAGLEGWVQLYSHKQRNLIADTFNAGTREVFNSIDLRNPWPPKNNDL